MRWIFAAVVAVLSVGSPATAQSGSPVEVMIVGTYHLDNPGQDLNNPKADDALKPQRQKELEAIAAALAEFRPTKIMVERVAKTPDLVDARYSEFTPAALQQQRDERVQIAYRLAHLLGFETVHAIDEQSGEGEPDYFPFGKVAAWAQANGAKARLDAAMAEGAAIVARIEELQSAGSIADVLVDLNRPERTARDQSFYYQMLSLGDTDQQPGAELNAYWYMRNAKIFGKLMTVAEPGDRVLVVYGSGHNYWLRHFAKTTPGFRNVDPTPFLEAAAKASR